jgi:hypothetical protein
MRIPNREGVYEGDGLLVSVTSDKIVIAKTHEDEYLPQPQKSNSHFWQNAGEAIQGINDLLSGKKR